MSDEPINSTHEDEDVEAHRRRITASDEPSEQTDDDDDVEAHVMRW